MPLAPARAARVAEALDLAAAAAAVGHVKAGSKPENAPVLAGRLFVSDSGWGMVSVPNALVRGVFDAMHEPGIELPLKDGKLTAHISVFTKDEVEALGGPDAISERGHSYKYQLGPLKTIAPQAWDDVSRCWFLEVQSPELKTLRKSYGLAPLPYGDHELHATVAVRRKHVLKPGEIRKAAAAARLVGLFG